MSPRPHCKRKTLAELPFRELVQKDEELKKQREKYARLASEDRRKAAQWSYASAHAAFLVAQAVKRRDLDQLPVATLLSE